MHALTGRGGEALPYFDAALKLQPAYSTAAIWQSSTLAQLGRHDEALASAHALAGDGGRARVGRGLRARQSRAADEARAVLRALQAHAQRQYVAATEFAFLHLALGEQDAALSLG